MRPNVRQYTLLALLDKKCRDFKARDTKALMQILKVYAPV